MKLLKKMLKGTAVYWEPTGINDSGDPEVGLPVQIKCRWEDSIEQGLDSSGTETTFKSTVYVDRIVEEGGMLMKGTLNDLKGNKPPKEAHRIRLFNIIPNSNIKYKESLKEVKL